MQLVKHAEDLSTESLQVTPEQEEISLILENSLD